MRGDAVVDGLLGLQKGGRSQSPPKRVWTTRRNSGREERKHTNPVQELVDKHDINTKRWAKRPVGTEYAHRRTCWKGEKCFGGTAYSGVFVPQNQFPPQRLPFDVGRSVRGLLFTWQTVWRIFVCNMLSTTHFDHTRSPKCLMCPPAVIKRTLAQPRLLTLNFRHPVVDSGTCRRLFFKKYAPSLHFVGRTY